MAAWMGLQAAIIFTVVSNDLGSGIWFFIFLMFDTILLASEVGEAESDIRNEYIATLRGWTLAAFCLFLLFSIFYIIKKCN
jgi:hypothetical protein